MGGVVSRVERPGHIDDNPRKATRRQRPILTRTEKCIYSPIIAFLVPVILSLAVVRSAMDLLGYGRFWGRPKDLVTKYREMT